MARALYIHWPFCLKKCPYCDFNSHVRAQVDYGTWKNALLTEMEREFELAGGNSLESVFFGGGTPSLMPAPLVQALLDKARELWGFSDTVEITLEANPSTLESVNFPALASAGINRVSLGLQALDDAELRFLGRLHGVSESLKALELAQKHFSRVSFDLIYARPNQSAEQWEAELTRALSFGTDHLSLYQLTIEEGTRFATLVREGAFTPLEDDPAADLFQITRSLTASAGMPAYEVSNHARAGQESRHNLTYWRYRDYVGIGPGAHGRRHGVATTRHKKPENYLSAVANTGTGLQEERKLSLREQASEAMLMGLRLAEGLDAAQLAGRFGLCAADVADEAKLALYTRQGLMWQQGDKIGVTEAGMLVLNALIAEVVPAELVE